MSEDNMFFDMIGAKVINFDSDTHICDNGDSCEIVKKLILEKDGKKYNVSFCDIDWEWSECIVEEIV